MRFSGRSRWIFFITVAVAGFLIDWYTKTAVVNSLEYGRPHSIIGNFVQFLFVYNTGAIFGLNPRHWMPWFPVNLFFYLFSGIAIVILTLYYRSVPSHKSLLQWGVALVMPGALGNFFDRVIHPSQGVVDFIRVGVSDRLYWPIFNMADIYITVGVGLILLELIREEFTRKRPAVGEAAKI
jgi:signal peptidase II